MLFVYSWSLIFILFYFIFKCPLSPYNGTQGSSNTSQRNMLTIFQKKVTYSRWWNQVCVCAHVHALGCLDTCMSHNLGVCFLCALWQGLELANGIHNRFYSNVLIKHVSTQAYIYETSLNGSRILGFTSNDGPMISWHLNHIRSFLITLLTNITSDSQNSPACLTFLFQVRGEWAASRRHSSASLVWRLVLPWAF